jgi:hypothetical protein
VYCSRLEFSEQLGLCSTQHCSRSDLRSPTGLLAFPGLVFGSIAFPAARSVVRSVARFLAMDSTGQGHTSRLPLSNIFPPGAGVSCSISVCPGAGVHPGVVPSARSARLLSCAVHSLQW